MPRRHIVQVACAISDDRSRPHPTRVVVALCSDHTVWEYARSTWHQLEPIPQPEPTGEKPTPEGTWEAGSAEPRPTSPGQEKPGGAPKTAQQARAVRVRAARSRAARQKGGRMRAAKLSPDRRSQIARKAACARWSGGALGIG